MHLTPHERDKLLVHVAADVARRRLERGVLLNYPEAVALITDHVLEGARDGRTVRVRQTVKQLHHVAVVADPAYPAVEPLAVRSAPVVTAERQRLEYWNDYRRTLMLRVSRHPDG